MCSTSIAAFNSFLKFQTRILFLPCSLNALRIKLSRESPGTSSGS